MKKVFLLSLLSASLLIACGQNQDKLELDKAVSIDQELVISLSNHKVYKNEFASYVKSRTQQDLEKMNPEVQKTLFAEFVQLELLSRKAVNSGLNKTKEYALQTHNLKKNLLAQALLKQFEQDNPISEVDIAAQYEIAKTEFEIPQLKARHILLKTAAEAQTLIDLLNIGKSDFAELAKEKSIGPSGPNGGDLNWFSPAQMFPNFSAAAIELETGSFSQVPVETQAGFHIILKENERIGSAPPLENLRPRLEQKIKQDRLEKYMQELRIELQIQESFKLPEK